MLDLILGGVLMLIVFALALLDLNVAMREYAKLGIADEELVKMNAKGSKAYWQRVVDILFFLLIAVLVQSFAIRFNVNPNALGTAYPQIILYSALALAPFGLGYIWTLLPPGRKGMIDAVLAKLGKAEVTRGSRLHVMLWRPWLGAFYFLFYFVVLFSIYLSLRGQP